MRVTVLVVLTVALLWLGACADFPLFRKTNPVQDDHGQTAVNPASATMELQNIDYDGEALRGRLLIGAQDGTIRIDKRLIENISLSLKGVSNCASGQELYFIRAGVVAPPLREEEILALKPGYWYGKDVRVSLFDQHLLETQGRPECIDVDLMLHVLEGKSALLRVRAMLTPSSGEGSGAPAPDAGTPPADTTP
jgi:hypothetical protein